MNIYANKASIWKLCSDSTRPTAGARVRKLFSNEGFGYKRRPPVFVDLLASFWRGGMWEAWVGRDVGSGGGVWVGCC